VVELAIATSALGNDAAAVDGAVRGWSIAPARDDDTRGHIRSCPSARWTLRSADVNRDATPCGERNRKRTSDDVNEDLNLNKIAVAAVVVVVVAGAAVVVLAW